MFIDNWNKWESAVLKYASSSKNKPAGLKYALRDKDGTPGNKIVFAYILYAFVLCNLQKW